MLNELLTMSKDELKRIEIIRRASDRNLKQKVAMQVLGLSKRQVIRLVQNFRRDGEKALISKRRGKAGNHAHSGEFKLAIKAIVENNYSDFGPSFAAEKLLSINALKINKETLRQWMDEWGLWKAKPKKVLKLQQSRTRRSSFGELIQIDGSHHDWFEGRGAKCCLLVFIDDATSRLVGLRFEEEETSEGYFKLCRSYVETYGRPLALYSDKFSVFRINLPGQEEAQTQFGRAMAELDIELICAHSAPAKGRVERANGTLQDRLVKELRLRNLKTIEAANAYLPEFIAGHNDRFAVAPRNNIDAHRKEMPEAKTLDLIFSFQHERKLSKQLETSYDKRIFQIQEVGRGYRLQHKAVTICENMQGEIHILYKGSKLNFNEYKKQHRAPEIIDSKGLEKKMDLLRNRAKQLPPAKNHPWRIYAVTADKKFAQAMEGGSLEGV
jgi:transposase